MTASQIIVYCLWTSFPIILYLFHCLLLFVIYTFTSPDNTPCSHIFVVGVLFCRAVLLCFFWILFSGYSCAGASYLCLVWIIVFIIIIKDVLRWIIFYKVFSVIL